MTQETVLPDHPVPAPRLTIAIATFNRADFIGETLDSMLPQLAQDVELLVVDGASTDGTGEVLAAYCQRHRGLRYVRLPTNSGVDRDFDTAVALARGEYCWLMTDDDILRPGAVARVLDAIASGYDLIIVNAEVRDRDLTEQIDGRRLAFEADRIYGPAELDRLFSDTGAYLTFIGGVVVRRSTWMSRDREPYYGTLFIHVGVLFQKPLERSALVVSDPLIAIRYGNAMWTSRAFEIWMFKWPELVWALSSLSEAARRSVTPREPWRSWRHLLAYRAFGAYSREQYSRWLRPRYRTRRAAWPALLISAFPSDLLKWVARLYFRLGHRLSRMPLYDARNCRPRPAATRGNG